MSATSAQANVKFVDLQALQTALREAIKPHEENFKPFLDSIEKDAYSQAVRRL